MFTVQTMFTVFTVFVLGVTMAWIFSLNCILNLLLDCTHTPFEWNNNIGNSEFFCKNAVLCIWIMLRAGLGLTASILNTTEFRDKKKTLAGCCYSQLWILMCNMCRSYCNLSSINTLFWTVGLNVHMAWIHTKSLSSFSNSITPMFMVREHLQDHDSDHD